MSSPAPAGVTALPFRVQRGDLTVALFLAPLSEPLRNQRLARRGAEKLAVAALRTGLTGGVQDVPCQRSVAAAT